jgi:hypothetical protein
VDAEIAALRAETLDTLRNWLFESSLGPSHLFYWIVASGFALARLADPLEL